EEVRPELGQLPLQFRTGRNGPAAASLSRRERSGEFTTLDLSASAFRDFRHNPDEAGHLEAGEAFAGKVSKLLYADLRTRTQYNAGGDGRAKSAMRDREKRRL